MNDCETIVNECEERIKDEVLDEVGGYLVDDEFSLDSENPVQNKVVTEALNNKLDKVENTTSYNLIYASKPQKNGEPSEQTTIRAYYIARSSYIPIYDACLGGYNPDGTINTTLNGAVKTGIPERVDHATPKKWVEDLVNEKTGVFSPLHHFVIIPPDTDRTYNFYMVLPGQTEAFNTLAEFIDYIHGLSPINNVMYFAGTSTEMNFDPSGFTQLKFEMDDLSINIIGLKIDGNYIPKEEVESDTGATLFAFSDTVLL